MGKYFALLLSAAVLMILLASGGIYGLVSSTARKADRDAAAATVNGMAESVSAHISAVNTVLDNMGRDPHLIAAVQGGDGAQISAVLKQFEPLLPGSLKLRLILPGAIAPDESEAPKMGFADVDMVRETFSGDQAPMVQGESADRHLAVARGVKPGPQAIAVLLASLKYDFLNSIIATKAARQLFIELQQEGVVLASSGDAAWKDEAGGAELKIPSTAWTLKYWLPADTHFVDFGLLTAVIALPLLLTVLIFFIGYRRFAVILRDDQNNIVRFIKDLILGKTQSNYPVHIDELRVIISSAMQFKRIVESEKFAMNAGADILAAGEEDLTISESLDVDSFFSSEPASPPIVKSIPLVMPDAKAESDESRDLVDFSLPKAVSAAIPAKTAENVFGKPPIFTTGDVGGGDKSAGYDSIFRAYDIRGTVGDLLSKERGYDLGCALGSEALEHGCSIMVVGRDGRNSSPGLSDAVSKGIMSVGVNVLDIGLAPSPVLYFVTHHHPGQCGVMITGSHHGPEYNGLKMVVNGETLADKRIQDLKKRIELRDFASGTTGSRDANALFVNEYIGMICEDVHLGRPMKIVVDCGNGAAGTLAPVLLKTLGCEVIELFCEIDGNFPNHAPDPSVADNLNDLRAAVRHYEAELGIAFDGDGDRLGVVDSGGKIIYPDRQMMLYAKDVLAANRGAEIVFDVKCSRHLPERIKKYGGRPLMWKTGRPYIRAKLQESGAKLAGEMSGSIFFNDRWFGFDDALYAAARLIEILSADSRQSAEVFADFPEWTCTPEVVVEMPQGKIIPCVEALIAAAQFSDAEITTIDGLRADFSDGWGLVRASNTRPALVMRFEAENTRALVRIQTQFKHLLQKIEPDLRLPF